MPTMNGDMMILIPMDHQATCVNGHVAFSFKKAQEFFTVKSSNQFFFFFFFSQIEMDGGPTKSIKVALAFERFIDGSYDSWVCR